MIELTQELARAQQRIYEIFDDSALPIVDKQREALSIGQEFLDVENANIQRQARGDETKDTVVVSVGDDADLLPEGMELDPETTYCRRTVDTHSPVALSDAPNQGWADDPAYRKHRFDCYLGTEILVGGDVYGTLCFLSRDARQRDFSTEEKAFVELLARLIGREIEVNEHQNRIDRKNQTIRQFADKYETLLRSAPEAIFLARAGTGVIDEVNEAAGELTGYAEPTLREMSVFELVPDAEQEQYEQLFCQECKTVSTDTFPDGTPLQLERADGTTIPIEITAKPVKLDGRQYLLAIVEDITDRRRRVQKLKRTREFLEQVQETVDLGGWEVEIETGTLSWTDEVYRIYGLSPDVEPSIEAALDHFHPEDQPVIEQAFDELAADGTPYDLELRLLDDDDTVQWVRTLGRPQYDEDTGELVALRGVIQKITDRKQRERELHLRGSAIEEAPVGVTISDATRPDNPIIYANDEFQELTGYPRERVIGENCRFLQGEQTDEETTDAIRHAVDSEEFIQTRILNYRANQTPFWNQLTISPVTGEDDEGVTHFVGIQEDVTAQQRRERLLELLNRILRHNLRNSMNVIGGYAAEIAKQNDGHVAEMATHIRQQSTELMTLSEKARSFQESVSDQEQHAPRAICDDVETVATELQQEYPESDVRTDLQRENRVMGTDQMLAALKEVGRNALVHGSDTVTFRVESTDDAVIVHVEDNGPGLPSNERAVLNDGDEGPLTHGSSIGLWVVNWVVTSMGGEVTARVDDGTTVTLRFPSMSGGQSTERLTSRQRPLDS